MWGKEFSLSPEGSRSFDIKLTPSCFYFIGGRFDGLKNPLFPWDGLDIKLTDAMSH